VKLDRRFGCWHWPGCTKLPPSNDSRPSLAHWSYVVDAAIPQYCASPN
jgi:hypothetical protein